MVFVFCCWSGGHEPFITITTYVYIYIYFLEIFLHKTKSSIYLLNYIHTIYKNRHTHMHAQEEKAGSFVGDGGPGRLPAETLPKPVLSKAVQKRKLSPPFSSFSHRLLPFSSSSQPESYEEEKSRHPSSLFLNLCSFLFA